MCPQIVHDWKTKADGLTGELDLSQRECRNSSSELFRVKNGYEECLGNLEEVRRENKSLSEEIRDIMEQISEGGRSIHEIEKARKRLEGDKVELTGALEEAEATLEQEENKHARLEMEIMQVKSEIEKRLAEKEEEFEGVKRNHQKLLEQMQEALEAESKAKAELLRTRKKLEADVAELEGAMEQAHQIRDENQRNIRKYQDGIQHAGQEMEEEQRARDMARDALVAAERKANALSNALEESRTMLEQADRARRAAEQELTDCHETISDLTVANQSLGAMKRRLDQELENIRADLEEMPGEAGLAEDRSRRAMLDAAKLAVELRAEQEHTGRLEVERRVAEATMKELQVKIDDVETAALKHGKRACGRLDGRVKVRSLRQFLNDSIRYLAGAGDGAGLGAQAPGRLHQDLEEGREEDEGAPVPERGGRQAPRPHAGARGQAAEQAQVSCRVVLLPMRLHLLQEFQAADRGGRGDRRSQPGQVPQGPGKEGVPQRGTSPNLLPTLQAEAEEAEERASLNEHAMAKLRALGRAGSAQPFN